MLWRSVALLALLASAQGRAVNISNTWVLPEEGFPVFYRYFRDRISWYEADAVCQFHHANLVTVDTTAQYDAVRAYLKELDISSAVWVGLIRSNPDGDFTWTDYRGLSGDGYWSAAPDSRSSPLCAAADPASDYRWDARACGGPTVASFVCELPVPQWALGNEGCMVRALPALTILYLPESAAVQLTADCGLAGVKRVQCTGNVKREKLLKDLSCADNDETTTSQGVASLSMILPVTTDSSFSDQDNLNDTTTEDVNITTDHGDNTNKSTTIIVSTSSNEAKLTTVLVPVKKILNKNKLNQIFIEKSINLGSVDRNNQQSNFIPKIVSDENLLTDEQQEQLEDEKHIQHKMLHEEFAKMGNFENIFTQPTDHFVPPLVMAKSKISDDMTVLSLAEKHAQQLAEQHFTKQSSLFGQTNKSYQEYNTAKTSTKAPVTENTDKPIVTTLERSLLKNNLIKDKVKNTVPKKYIEKYNDPSSKIYKMTSSKSIESYNYIEHKSTPAELASKKTETTTIKTSGHEIATSQVIDDGPVIDLKVIIKENSLDTIAKKLDTSYTGEVPKSETIHNMPKVENFHKMSVPNENETWHNITTTSKLLNGRELRTNGTFIHEIVTVTIPTGENSALPPTVLEISTHAPIFFDSVNNEPTNPTHILNKLNDSKNEILIGMGSPSVVNHIKEGITSNDNISMNLTSPTTSISYEQNNTNILSFVTTEGITEISSVSHIAEINNNETTESIVHSTLKENYEVPEIEDHETDIEYNTTHTFENIDDFQSPLLSGANEPLPRPNRSRRPQPQPNRLKFNPFRILG